MNFRNAVLRTALVSLAAVLAFAVRVSAEAPIVFSTALAPELAARLGSAAPLERAKALGFALREWPAPGAPPMSGRPFLALLRDTGTPGNPRFEVSGASLELQLGKYAPIHLENARVVLVPSADGRTCRFELSGSPFGAGSTIEATGNVEWKAGPGGGDKLDIEFRLNGAPVDAVRAWAPTRMDPSFGGTLAVTGKASGVVAEVTTEEAPATPLKGEFQATLDWTALGRTAPMTIRSQFALDDRMVRLTNGRMSWLEEALDLKGWVKPEHDGEYDLIASFANVDTAAVAARWEVPLPWRPVSTLSGQITMKGKPGQGLMRHEARSSLITVPALGGYDIRVEDAMLSGSLMAVNAEVAVSVRAKRILVGGIDLGTLPVGIRWWENRVIVSNSNSKLFGGENDGSLSYEPAKHPAFELNGRVKNAEAPVLIKGVVPWLDLDLGGVGSVAFQVGQDEARTPKFSFHGSITQGNLGGVDLFGATIAELAKVDPALTLPAGALPVPRKGTGTRIDRAFFEADRKGEVFELGGLFVVGGDFRLDGDGSFTRADGLALEASVQIPKAAADQLVAAAPWAASPRRGESMFVPVTVRGPLSALKVALAPGFEETLAKAKRGEAVEPATIRYTKHVGPDNLAVIPVDPANDLLQ
jgi:hypothetical protein